MVNLAKTFSIAVILLVLISSSTALACGLSADQCTYKANSDVKLSYDTDVINGSHVIIIQKDGSTVATFDRGTENASSVTWNCGPAEGKYLAKLLVNGEQYASCDIYVRNDDVAPTTAYSFSKPQNADGSYDAGVRLSFTATDNDGGSGVAAIYYWYSDGCHKTYSSPLEFSQPGTYTVTFKAADRAGNLETVDGHYRTLTFTVNSPAPAPTVEPTPVPTATPTVAPTICPTTEPTAEPQTITRTAHDVNDPGAGTEAIFTTKSTAAEDNPENSTVVTTGIVAGTAVVAGAVLLIFRRL